MEIGTRYDVLTSITSVISMTGCRPDLSQTSSAWRLRAFVVDTVDSTE